MPRQVSYEQYGGVEVLQLVDMDTPVPGHGELLIEVRAAGVNPFEVKLRKGLMEGQFPFTFPAAQGTDVAGVVVAVGPGVMDFKAGDEIVGSAAKRGAQADFTVVSQAKALPRPPHVPWEVAGSLWVVGTTAQAMVNAIDIGRDDLVLVSGASGGVGALVSQLARERGAAVIGVASERNHEWLRSLGILPVIYGDDAETRIQAAAAEHPRRRLSAVLDTSGGGYVELGITLGVEPARIDTIVDYGAAERHGAKTEGGGAGTTAQIAELLTLLNDGRVELPIHATYPLDQVQEAYTELEHGHPRGKIVLIP
jgi:NADPH:quinone reductase-like Zn-dependent oxidoreductase